MRIGIRSSSAMIDGRFGNEQLVLLKEIGFDLVELSFNCMPLDYQNTGQCEELHKAATRLGMNYTAHAPDTIRMTSPDPDEIKTGIRVCLDVLDSAAICGAETLVVHACPYVPIHPGKEHVQKEHLSFALESVVRKCEEKRIRLAIETMIPGCITSSIDNIIAAVDRVNSPWIGICIDTNHANLSMSLSNAILKAGNRIREFHLNDNHLEKEEHLLPYDGLIDWSAFARAVAEISYQGNMIMEPSWRPGQDPLRMLRKAFGVAERMLGIMTE